MEKQNRQSSLVELDQINSSFPMAVTKRAHQIITRRVKEIDAPLLNGLEAVQALN